MNDLISIDEVARIAKVSRQTIYRRVKQNKFPKPVQVQRTKARGPRTVNMWKKSEVMGWLMKGNDPAWLKQPVRDIQNAVEDKPGEIRPRLTVQDEKPFWENHLLLAVVGGVLAAVAYQLFRG